MKEHFSEQLESLRRQLIGMGAEVENQIRLAIEALVEADAAKARRVIERDKVDRPDGDQERRGRDRPPRHAAARRGRPAPARRRRSRSTPTSSGSATTP